jgi:hypothetical protein
MAETQTMQATGPESSGGGLGQWLALIGAAVAVVATIVLVVSWPNDGSGSLKIDQTAPAPAAEAAPAPAPPASIPVHTANAGLRVRTCQPIFGGGVPHPVMSSARHGAPAGCGEAHSVLLGALNGGTAGVGGWHCTSGNGRTLEACTSGGGRRIAARG